MDKNGLVVFSEWYKGMVNHPIYGFSLLKNVEVFENLGIAKLKNRLVQFSDMVTAQMPLAEEYDVYGNTYTLTGENGPGKVYKNGVAIVGATNLPNAWDMKIYKDYIWVRHSTVMSCYGPLNNSPQWFANVDTGFTDFYNGKLLVGQDDFLYTCNGNYIAKIEVTSSGTPAVTPTITSTKNALDLPDGQFACTMVEFGAKIIIGTHNGSSYSDRSNFQGARLYPWNRQAGTLGNPGLADLPVVFNESGINAIIQHANKLYVSAGTQGNIYVTDSVNYQRIATLPYTDSGINSSSTVYTNAMSINSRGNLVIGLSADLNSTSKPGIYEINLIDSKYPVEYRQVSSSTDGTLKIGFITSRSYTSSRVGWANNTSYGVDYSDNSSYKNYGGVIETPMVKVGNYNSKHTFSHIEWSLAEPLITNQSIRISYRLNNKDTYTLIKDWTFAVLGGVLSFEDTAAITDAEYVQLKIELNESGSVPYGSNINLISVKIW